MNREEENDPQPLRIIGNPKYENGRFVFADDIFAILNRECGWICPRCFNEVRICPTTAGEQTFKCTNKHCSATFVVRVDAEAVTFMPAKKKKSPASASAAIDSAGAIGVAAAGAAAAVAAHQQVQKPARGMLLMPVDDDTPKKPDTPAIKPKPKKPVVEKPVVEDDDDNETVIVQQPKNTPASTASQQESSGSLQWGGFFSRKHYKLLVGANVIGRKDKKTPSDVEFDDPEMSRRSVKIDAIPDGQGDYSFTLTVMKALNPVKVNDQQVIQGASTTLKHNDTITMGKTTLTFKCS